ncbi:MAG TPA: VIT and VWA domain-containing protein [Thermoanaerobaculia bacterium]|jgi:Ca-activated chloride channel family protein|nr:VIT and VWA domain-containing protein [Thermoanaerobaculia bacterium]
MRALTFRSLPAARHRVAAHPLGRAALALLLRRATPLILILLAFVLGAGNPCPASAAGLLVADGGLGGVLAIERHEVRVTINNGIAVTEVEQTFRNTESRVVEALYTFPVPRGASVSGFSMWIGGKEMVGEVVERERARQIYDSYKQQKRDPGLLEQADYKTFEMRIFPIAAGADQRVRIVYYQELDVDADWATWVYPLATASRAGLDARTQGPFKLDVEIRSEVPIVGVESPSHGAELVVAQHGATYAQASLEQGEGDLQRDVVVSFHSARPRTGLDLVASRAGGEDGYFLLTLTGGEELAKAGNAMDYVFVLDVSGSMDDDGKLALSRDSLGAFVRALAAEDRFELIAFNVAPTAAFGSLRQASDDAKREAASFLASQQARGGTFLEPALRAAYRHQQPDRALNVVILSDGMTEQAERSELLRLAAERPPKTRLFTIGIGNDVDRQLLEQLAEDAGGLAAFVSRGDDFARQAKAFQRKLQRPAMTNIEIALDGCGAYDLEPLRLPALYNGLPVRLYGRYRQPGPATLTLRGDVGGEHVERKLSVEFPPAEENPEIERMWAWKRVDRLLKEAEKAGDKRAAVDEVVRLGEAFSIVTEHTSFLVLENDAEYRRWKIERRNALRSEREGRRLERLRQQLAGLRRDGAGLGPEGVKIAEAKPAAVPGAVPASGQRWAPTTNQPSRKKGGMDVDLGGGGGAFDPLTAGLALALAGAAAAGRRRRER